MVCPSQISRYFPANISSGHEKVVAMKAYIDASGNYRTSDVVVLAGVAADDPIWVGFEEEWGKILQNRDPIAPYLHMNEINSKRGAFTDEKGWTDELRGKLIMECAAFASRLDKNKFRTFFCTVDMAAHREISAKLPQTHRAQFPSCVTLCNKYVPMQIFKWYLENFSIWSSLDLHYFFDQNEPYCGPFDTLRIKRQKKSWTGLFNHWDIVKQATPVNMREFRPVQLADLLAWLHSRRLNPHREDLPWASFYQVTDEVLPFTRKEINRKDLEWIAHWTSVPQVLKAYFYDLTFREHWDE